MREVGPGTAASVEEAQGARRGEHLRQEPPREEAHPPVPPVPVLDPEHHLVLARVHGGRQGPRGRSRVTIIRARVGRSRTLLVLGAAWLAWIWVVAAVSDRTWPWLEGPHNWSYDVERRATPLTRWDSGWYVGIAEGGYEAPPTRVGQETNHAFFPLYPLLMRGLSRGLGIETSLAGNLVSGTAFLLALLLFGGWVERHHGRERVLPAAAVLLIFPTSLFFAAVYTESLVLLLALATVVALERGRLV
ncbi:hypothetical protein FBQ97_20500, partial [Acidobacteria bacterium ACD]|nr:hypothetical protein [Acidobacteria bacterium ACD]